MAVTGDDQPAVPRQPYTAGRSTLAAPNGLGTHGTQRSRPGCALAWSYVDDLVRAFAAHAGEHRDPRRSCVVGGGAQP